MAVQGSRSTLWSTGANLLPLRVSRGGADGWAAIRSTERISPRDRCPERLWAQNLDMRTRRGARFRREPTRQRLPSRHPQIEKVLDKLRNDSGV